MALRASALVEMAMPAAVSLAAFSTPAAAANVGGRDLALAPQP